MRVSDYILKLNAIPRYDRYVFYFPIQILCICLAIYMILRIVQDEKEGKINPWTD